MAVIVLAQLLKPKPGKLFSFISSFWVCIAVWMLFFNYFFSDSALTYCLHHWVCKGVEEEWCTLQEVKISVVWADYPLWKSIAYGTRSLKIILRLGREHVQFHLLAIVLAWFI